MKNYLKLLNKVYTEGVHINDRTGVGTKSLFGQMLSFTLLDDGTNYIKQYPAVTTKKLAFKSMASEVLWMLEGSSNERRLAEILYQKPRSELADKRTIWTANYEHQGKQLGYTDGELGPIYGYSWRNWIVYDHEHDTDIQKDQILEVITSIKTNPFSRRHIISAWNVGELQRMALPPCHILQQYHVVPDSNGKPYYLDLMIYQRSADMFLGVPFDIASYALLLTIIARCTGLKAHTVTVAFGDTHIYINHLDAVKEQLCRTPYDLPVLKIPDICCLEDVLNSKVSDYGLLNYKHHEPIKAAMAV